MTAAVRIRLASFTDIPALQGVFRRASMSNEGDRELFGRHPELLTWSGSPVEEGRTRVADVEGRVVGFASLSLDGPTAEVEDLFVDPDCMGRGIGRALIDDLLAIALEAGRLHVEVDANPHAVAFYARVGFVALGEVPVEFGSGVRMRCRTVR